MGIIKKQTIKGTIINYIGVLIGFVTTAILSPLIDSKTIGLLSVIVSYSVIISQFGTLGFSGIATKLFPYFRTSDNKNNGFLFLGIIISITGFIISIIIILLLKNFAYSGRATDDALIQNFYYIIPVVFFQIALTLFDSYYIVIFNAIKGIYLRELVQKLGTFTAILMMVAGMLGFDAFVFTYLLGFSLPGIIIVIQAISDKKNSYKAQLSFIDSDLKKSIISVGLFSIISGASGLIAINIDKIMIESMSGLSSAGVYSIAFYFGLIISIPARSLLRIASALIAQAWKNKDTNLINDIYKKSTINLTIIGSLFLIGLYINIDNIISLLKGEYASGYMVILLIATAFLTDMIGGTASQILFSSRLYKLQTYLMIAYVFIIIITNYFFIPLYGINGAAIATLISKFSINLIRYIIIYFAFKFQPYNYKFALIILISIVVLAINYYIPKQNNFIIDIFVRSSVISIAFILMTYFLKLSEDINIQINTIINKFRK